VAAVVALIVGSLIAAIVLLAFAVVAFVFFYDAARRNPEDRVARSVISSGHHLRGWTRFAIASISAWGRASRDVVQLRRESRSLQRERERPTLRLLGEAVYGEVTSRSCRRYWSEFARSTGELEKREDAARETRRRRAPSCRRGARGRSLDAAVRG
jgi:hypothetical protein